MSTLIENVNDIVLIKEELDALLNEYGVDGGEQFDTYPEKFRELFRLIQDSTTIAVDTLYQEVDTVTIVADPVIWQSDNIIQITCATIDAVIYYRMVGLDTGTDWGETEYKNKFYISENAHIEAYAMDKNKQYRSGTVWINAEYVLGNVPEKPVINRDRSTGDVTMSCETDGASIYFRNGGSDWTLYTGEVYIPLADDIYAYSVKDGVASDIVFDEGLDDTVRPAIPVISYSNNTITITDSTEGAIIYYRERLSDTWILYEGPVTISESGWYVAIAYKDGIYSEQTDPPLFCEYVSPIPLEPEISCENNTVTIICDTEGATIYYKEEDSDIWLVYTQPFTITETTTIESKSFKNGYYSDIVSVECEYDDSGSGGGGDTPSYQKPEKPEMSLYYNTVTITCATEGATIYWMYLLDNTWIEYEGPFQIDKSGYYVSKAVKNDIESDLSDVAYFEYDSGIDYIVPAVPVIDCYANEVSITCSTEDADIYYRIGSSGSFTLYTTPFSISDTVTVYSYSTLNGVDSDTTSKECVYYETPTAPIITCEENRVYITSEDGGKIYYKETGDTDWLEYTSSFVIFESSYYDARVFKNGLYSIITTTLCEYDSESEYEDYLNSYLTIEIGDLEDIPQVDRELYFDINLNTNDINYSTYLRTIEYNKNGLGWNTITTSRLNSHIHVESGDKIQLRGNNSTYYHTRIWGAAIIIPFKVYGNIMSLVNKTEFASITTLTEPHIFDPIFYGGSVTDARNLVLPATTLSPYCYASMFETYTVNGVGDNLLEYGPELPADTLADYCYYNMFKGCKNLQEAPELPATTLAVGCYYSMFWGCGSITAAPALSATTLENSCYYGMFYGCTGLLTTPNLTAQTLVTDCYRWMFYGCLNLQYIICLATSGINTNGSTTMWVNMVPNTSSVKFYKASGVTWPISGSNGIKSNWTIIQV